MDRQADRWKDERMKDERLRIMKQREMTAIVCVAVS